MSGTDYWGQACVVLGVECQGEVGGGQACVVPCVECQGEVIGVRHVWFMVLSVRKRLLGLFLLKALKKNYL